MHKLSPLAAGAISAVVVVAVAAPASAAAPSHLQMRQPTGVYAPVSLTPGELNKPDMVCIRFNNFWCVKDARWKGEIGKDARGHAQFDNPVSGARAFALLMHAYRYKYNLKTADQLIARYAPSDDCVGSIGTPPNCPYGINPVAEYSARVAKAVGKGTNEDLKLFTRAGKIDVKVAIPLFQAFSSFELTDKYRPDQRLIVLGIRSAGLPCTQRSWHSRHREHECA